MVEFNYTPKGYSGRVEYFHISHRQARLRLLLRISSLSSWGETASASICGKIAERSCLCWLRGDRSNQP